jgi:hypothetical protein
MKVALLILGMISVFAANDSHGFGRGRSNQADNGNSAPPVVVNPPANVDTGTGGIQVVLRQQTNFTGAWQQN